MSTIKKPIFFVEQTRVDLLHLLRIDRVPSLACDSTTLSTSENRHARILPRGIPALSEDGNSRGSKRCSQ